MTKPKPNIDEICFELTSGIIEVIREAISRRGFSAPASAVITLRTLELLSTITAPCCKVLASHTDPNDVAEYEKYFAALLLHNLTIRDDARTSFRVVVEQTCNEFEARYNTPSQLGLDILHHLTQVLARKPGKPEI